jgi:hypothetical protein
MKPNWKKEELEQQCQLSSQELKLLKLFFYSSFLILEGVAL